MNILIVGAGLAGATCARILAEAGNTITCIEKTDEVGGACFDYISDNMSCYIHKYGPHIFHTLNEDIWKFVNRFDEFSTFVNSILSKVNNKLYTFPINFNTLYEVYGQRVYSKEDAEELIHNDLIECNNPSNFEEAALAAIGIKLYEMFIKNYTKKQWKLDPKLLPIETYKRINIRYNFNNDLFQNQYQGLPKNGYTNLIKTMLKHPFINVEVNCKFSDYIKTHSNYDIIIYTGGFNLPYRSTKFIHYKDSKEDFAVMNLADDPIATRLTNFNVLHKYNNSTIHNFCLEIPAENNKYNELYPIEISENIKELEKQQKEIIKKYPNIIFVGRLATYKYLDMDKTIFQAMNICNKILNGEKNIL